MTDVWYRVEAQLVSAGVDEFDNPLGPSQVRICVRKYPVVKTTPKGVWLDVYGDKRFVRREARKRFACPTEQEAHLSFIARAERRCRILEAQTATTRRGIALAKRALGVADPLSFV
jgi:hypothetical protein